MKHRRYYTQKEQAAILDKAGVPVDARSDPAALAFHLAATVVELQTRIAELENRTPIRSLASRMVRKLAP